MIFPYASDAVHWMVANKSLVNTLVTYKDRFDFPCSGLPVDWTGHVERLREFCSHLSLDHGVTRANRILPRLANGDLSVADLYSQLVTLGEDIGDQLKERYFLRVSRTNLYDQEDLFGPDVSQKFSKTIGHIKESGTCIAVGRHTAAVYHLMCVLEVALDSLSNAVGVPYSVQSWQPILKDIEDKIALMGPTTGPTWKDDRDFYSTAAKDFKYFRAAWRNHTAHGRASFGEADADKVFEHVKDFMVHLSTRLCERP